MADKNHAEETREEAETDQGGKNENVNRKDQQKPNVCRRLDFGDSDCEKELNDLISLFNEDLERHRQKAMEKWNFDFENEIPLEGDWQWERVPVEPSDVKDIICTMENKHHGNRTV